MDKLPDLNPAREAARDPLNYAKTMGFGALEGAAGAKVSNYIAEGFRPNLSTITADIEALRAATKAQNAAQRAVDRQKAAQTPTPPPASHHSHTQPRSSSGQFSGPPSP